MTTIRDAIVIVIDGRESAETIIRIHSHWLDQGVPVIEVDSDTVTFWNPDVHPYRGHEWRRLPSFDDKITPFVLHLEELNRYFWGLLTPSDE
jgi:hypothetical protein